MVIAPPEPRPTETRLGTVSRSAKFRLEATGAPPPAGYTVKKPAADSLVAVTLRITALALEGTVTLPKVAPPMVRFMLPPLPRVPPFLVSSKRTGVTAVYTLPGATGAT